jgi:hypothetical protein
LYTLFLEEDVFNITKTEFKDYYGSSQYHVDAAVGSSPVTTHTNPRFDANKTGVVGTVDLLTAKEYRRGLKRDKTHYADRQVV